MLWVFPATLMKLIQNHRGLGWVEEIDSDTAMLDVVGLERGMEDISTLRKSLLHFTLFS